MGLGSVFAGYGAGFALGGGNSVYEDARLKAQVGSVTVTAERREISRCARNCGVGSRVALGYEVFGAGFITGCVLGAGTGVYEDARL